MKMEPSFKDKKTSAPRAKKGLNFLSSHFWPYLVAGLAIFMFFSSLYFFNKLNLSRPRKRAFNIYPSTSPSASPSANLKGLSTPRPMATSTPKTTPKNTLKPSPYQIDGPFAWGNLGTCFTLNENNKESDFESRPFSFSWKIDDNLWSAFSVTEAIKCYQDLSKGSHIVSVKVKGFSGQESGPLDLSFSN